MMMVIPGMQQQTTTIGTTIAAIIPVAKPAEIPIKSQHVKCQCNNIIIKERGQLEVHSYTLFVKLLTSTGHSHILRMVTVVGPIRIM